MNDSNGKKYVSYPWLITTAFSALGIVIIMGIAFLGDLRSRLDEIKQEFPKKLDAATYTEHLTRTTAIEAQLTQKVNAELFNTLCLSIGEMKLNQAEIMKKMDTFNTRQLRVMGKLNLDPKWGE